MKTTFEHFMKRGQYAALLTATAALLISAKADNQMWWLPSSGDFSTSANWSSGSVPTSTDSPTFDNAAGSINKLNDQTMNIDAGSHEIERIYNDWNAGGYVNTIGGPGTLVLKGQADQDFLGIANRSGANGGGTLRLAGNIEINREWGNNFTEVRNDNGANNVIELTSTSTLTLLTPLMCLDFTGQNASIKFNGTLLGSADLHIQSRTVSFNTGHDSSAFTGHVYFNSPDSVLTVNGGTVLNSGSKFIGNWGDAGVLALNGAHAVNGAGFTVYSSLTIDANSPQHNLGAITEVRAGKTLTIDISGLGGGEQLWFANSSAFTWDGTISVVGFHENAIRFGSDASGLTAEQLATINAGSYSLTSEGFLTAGSAPPAQPTVLPVYNDGGGNLVLRTVTEAGRNYLLLSTTSLTPPVAWVTNSTTAGTGGTITNTVPITPTPRSQFFRYQVQ